ncbi:carbohydrate esterase family 9 protein [Hydnum rufescens UP504]|uniref:Carbohydrate esterase family 9 protein n=1 Tax=Hydnum rufescens UP504 TaxID=1448309 RepID=A0A9P6DYD0_9AGAM|nr:carbohydrate esterase family 9 protein [Hydnum rufescens UP504]
MDLLCFTNCFLPQEDGSLVRRDLWVDSAHGCILDAQKTFYTIRKRPTQLIDLGSNILSPGFLDIQINGAYGFDFSIYSDDQSYLAGLEMISKRIVETGVTRLTQERSVYPKLLSLLSPHSFLHSASLLGWHAEGPFLQQVKRGAHAQPLLLSAPKGIASIEEVYGPENLAPGGPGVRMITAAPELQGIMESIHHLSDRGVIFSIGHSIASSKIATEAVLRGARLITHLFNAMPQLHHRDPAIIGLLGAGGPYSTRPVPVTPHSPRNSAVALDERVTPPQTPVLDPTYGSVHRGRRGQKGMLLAEGDEFERPFYGIIVDGIHSHPNSVRLAYTAHPEGCILVTDAMSFLDPHLPNGPHEWRDGRRIVKEGDKIFLEGTDTLAGSIITLDACVRNFSLFTSTPLSCAIRCATYNPAKCLGIENKKGTLRPGADADLVVLDRNDGTVLSTWVAGKMVWSRK